MARVSRTRARHPGVLVVAWYGALIGLGTLLLRLPVSHATDPVDVADAFFTATSAVTVTGLVVNDTAAAWSDFGQLVILALIQVGGIGIMTIAAFFGVALNRRLGLRSSLLAGQEIGLSDLGALRHLVRKLIAFAVISEIAVTLLLTVRFSAEDGRGLPGGFRLGVFHAVSAFNNAGFSTFAEGLQPYVGDWYVSLVIAGAFILGGLGFPVVFDIVANWRTPHIWSLHTKLTLAMTATLLAVGTVLVGMIEWSNGPTLGTLAADKKILAAFFQSATARTAGFNTVDISALRPTTLLVLSTLMVIGASSVSTGGGIKTSTFAVVVQATLAEFRTDPTTTIFHRRVSLAVQRQALALVVAALATVGVGTILIGLFEPSRSLIDVLFESASAFATTGLSTGITPDLDSGSRLVLVALMFIGRIGPITFGTAVLLRPERRRFQYPEEPIIVG